MKVAHHIVVDAPEVAQWCVEIEIDRKVLCGQKSRLFGTGRDAMVSGESV